MRPVTHAGHHEDRVGQRVADRQRHCGDRPRLLGPPDRERGRRRTDDHTRTESTHQPTERTRTQHEQHIRPHVPERDPQTGQIGAADRIDDRHDPTDCVGRARRPARCQHDRPAHGAVQPERQEQSAGPLANRRPPAPPIERVLQQGAGREEHGRHGREPRQPPRRPRVPHDDPARSPRRAPRPGVGHGPARSMSQLVSTRVRRCQARCRGSASSRCGRPGGREASGNGTEMCTPIDPPRPPRPRLVTF